MTADARAGAVLLAVVLTLLVGGVLVLAAHNPAAGLLAGSVLALVLTAFGRERV